MAFLLFLSSSCFNEDTKSAKTAEGNCRQPENSNTLRDREGETGREREGERQTQRERERERERERGEEP